MGLKASWQCKKGGKEKRFVAHDAAVMPLFPTAKFPRHHQHPWESSRVLKSHCPPIPGLVESELRAHCRCCSAPWVRMSKEGVFRQGGSRPP